MAGVPGNYPRSSPVLVGVNGVAPCRPIASVAEEIQALVETTDEFMDGLLSELPIDPWGNPIDPYQYNPPSYSMAMDFALEGASPFISSDFGEGQHNQPVYQRAERADHVRVAGYRQEFRQSPPLPSQASPYLAKSSRRRKK